MVGTVFLGAGAVPSIFAQFVFAYERGLASLHFCIVGGGASERAHGHMRDESAGSRNKCVCNSFFCPGVCSVPGPVQIVCINAFFNGVSCRWAHGAHAGRASLATERLCIVGPTMRSKQLAGTAFFLARREHLITWVLGCAVCTYRISRSAAAVQ